MLSGVFESRKTKSLLILTEWCIRLGGLLVAWADLHFTLGLKWATVIATTYEQRSLEGRLRLEADNSYWCAAEEHSRLRRSQHRRIDSPEAGSSGYDQQLMSSLFEILVNIFVVQIKQAQVNSLKKLGLV